MHAVIQFAKVSGFSPIIATGSLHNEAFIKSLGATHVIDRDAPLSELSDTIKAITGKPIKVAYDTISYPETQNAAYDVLAPGGKLVHVLFNALNKDRLTPDKETVHVYGNVYPPEQREVGRILYANLTSLLETGDIKVTSIFFARPCRSMLIILRKAQQRRSAAQRTRRHSRGPREAQKRCQCAEICITSARDCLKYLVINVNWYNL